MAPTWREYPILERKLVGERYQNSRLRALIGFQWVLMFGGGLIALFMSGLWR